VVVALDRIRTSSTDEKALLTDDPKRSVLTVHTSGQFGEPKAGAGVEFVIPIERRSEVSTCAGQAATKTACEVAATPVMTG